MLRRALRDARNKAGLSQAELAERVGLRTRDHYGKVERGEEPLPNALTDRLAAVLDVDPWVINPGYSGVTAEELIVLQKLRRIHRDRRRDILEPILAMLDTFFSRSNAA